MHFETKSFRDRIIYLARIELILLQNYTTAYDIPRPQFEFINNLARIELKLRTLPVPEGTQSSWSIERAISYA